MSRYIPSHEISRTLGLQKTLALPTFHALTGCDTTSAFFGKGKKTAWAAWQAVPEVTLPLQMMPEGSPNKDVIKDNLACLHRFVNCCEVI